jgi:hypothetical protein
MKRANTALVCVAASILSCSQPESWTASVYPDRDNLRDSITLGSFPSRIRCAAVAIDVLDRLGALARGDYECGLNCKAHADLPALHVCELTEKPLNPPGSGLPGSAVRSLHEQCMRQVAEHHEPSFLTTPVQVRARLGFLPSHTAARYREFADAVECLGATSDDVVPSLELGPTSFRVDYNGHAEFLGLSYRIHD